MGIHKAIYLCLFTGMLGTVFGQASAEIHRYKDANGKWHYTDNAEEIKSNNAEILEFEESLNVSSSQENIKTIAVQVPKDICNADTAQSMRVNTATGGYIGKKAAVQINKAGTKANPSIFVQNDTFAPVTFTFKFNKRENITTSSSVPLRLEVAPQSKAKVLDFKPTISGQRWSYNYSYGYKVGKLNPKHASDCHYLPPVPAGRQYKISQAFNGDFSHNNRNSMFAVDIGMPIGTDIVAARGGIIIDRDTEYVLSGLSAKFKSRANAIRILHSDGTIAVYAHLQFRSMRFYEGEVVEAGQVIGRSGNTGYSTGPHLHFAVHANQNMQINSVPFKFLVGGKPVVPKRGMILESISPNGAN